MYEIDSKAKIHHRGCKLKPPFAWPELKCPHSTHKLCISTPIWYIISVWFFKSFFYPTRLILAIFGLWSDIYICWLNFLKRHIKSLLLHSFCINTEIRDTYTRIRVTNSMTIFKTQPVVLSFEFNWKYWITLFAGEFCYTPSNQEGTCVYLQQCPYLVQIYGYNRRSNEVINYLLGSQRNCGNRAVNRNPIVCTHCYHKKFNRKLQGLPYNYTQ